mgnify:CR=1 FL=1
MPLPAPIFRRMKFSRKILISVAIGLAVSVFPMRAVYTQTIAVNIDSNSLAGVSTPKASASAVPGTKSMHPSKTYHIGPYDQIKISLLNANFAPRIVRVNDSGCINYPLAGENVCLAGLTPTEASDLLGSRIKLFEKTVIRVEVLEFASHTITIAGLVEQPGEQQIARDAVPFFVVRAGLVLSPNAASVRVIRNASQLAEDFRLNDPKLAAIFIYPGDIVEFY